MKIKKYMLIDLTLLIVIGVIVEAVGMVAFNTMINATLMTTACSLLIMFISITRWNWKGLIVAPFLVLATWIGGRFFNPHQEYKDAYGVAMFISSLVSLLSLSINLLWFKYKNYKETFKSIRYTLLLCFIDILISQLSLSLVFMIFTKQFNFLAFMAWNLFSFVILIVGVMCIRGQTVLVDVEKDMIEKSQEIKDTDFRISDDLEEEKGDLKDGENC